MKAFYIAKDHFESVEAQFWFAVPDAFQAWAEAQVPPRIPPLRAAGKYVLEIDVPATHMIPAVLNGPAGAIVREFR